MSTLPPCEEVAKPCKSKSRYPNLFSRLIAHSDEPENAQSCWVWNGQQASSGYGTITVRKPGGGRASHPINKFVHREMEHEIRGRYIETHLDDDPLGPIKLTPRQDLGYDETIDHLCGNRLCFNPDHWGEPISRSLNAQLRWQR